MAGSFKSAQPDFDTSDLFVSHANERVAIQRTHDKTKAIIEACYPDTEKLLDQIDVLGLPLFIDVPVFQLKMALMTVNARPGFISPTLPKYGELVKFLKKHVPTKAHMDFSHGLVIMPKDSSQFTAIAFEFYHWMAFKNGLEGYQHLALQLYDVFNRKHQGQLTAQFLDKLDANEVTLLRAAIRRDKEALMFIRHMMHEVFIPLNNASLLSDNLAQA